MILRHRRDRNCIPRNVENCRNLLCRDCNEDRRNFHDIGICLRRRRIRRLSRECRNCRICIGDMRSNRDYIDRKCDQRNCRDRNICRRNRNCSRMSLWCCNCMVCNLDSRNNRLCIDRIGDHRSLLCKDNGRWICRILRVRCHERRSYSRNMLDICNSRLRKRRRNVRRNCFYRCRNRRLRRRYR